MPKIKITYTNQIISQWSFWKSKTNKNHQETTFNTVNIMRKQTENLTQSNKKIYMLVNEIFVWTDQAEKNRKKKIWLEIPRMPLKLWSPMFVMP